MSSFVSSMTFRFGPMFLTPKFEVQGTRVFISNYPAIPCIMQPWPTAVEDTTDQEGLQTRREGEVDLTRYGRCDLIVHQTQ